MGASTTERSLHRQPWRLTLDAAGPDTATVGAERTTHHHLHGDFYVHTSRNDRSISVANACPT